MNPIRLPQLSPFPSEDAHENAALRCDSMRYDDVKVFGGRVYSGMRVGGTRSWINPRGVWRERKVAPDRWAFTFEFFKKRQEPSPEGSGAETGTQFHWYVLAHQRVKKIDRDAYATLMEGLTYKVAHKRPHWRRDLGGAAWSGVVAQAVEPSLLVPAQPIPHGLLVQIDLAGDLRHCESLVAEPHHQGPFQEASVARGPHEHAQLLDLLRVERPHE